jgi:hypothetical protein
MHGMDNFKILEVAVHWMMLSENLKPLGMDQNAGEHKSAKNLEAT